jgi:DNA replication ATP-dependent helicase Dna2
MGAFETSAERFREGAILNLVDCVADGEGFLVPGHIVLEPDYLIDASAIAECFRDYLISPLLYFGNRFEERENHSYLLLGNLANFFLDELAFAADPAKVTFPEVFLRSFRQSPFEYAACEELRAPDDFRMFMEMAKNQFENIRRVILDDFPRWGIDLHSCTLEPSFFSQRFGFQGRLDLLQPRSPDAPARIVELKSGRLPYPPSDAGRISLAHEVQAAVYRMMIEYLDGGERRPADTFILYSAGNRPGGNLRPAAADAAPEMRVVNLRNLIVAGELVLAGEGNGEAEALFGALFGLLRTGRKLPAFFTAKLERMRTLLSECSGTERAYFYRFVRFVSRELYLTKTGGGAGETPTGTAALWKRPFSERAGALDVLYDLSIRSVTEAGGGMTIVFARERAENDIVNFREGEICIAYPREDEGDTVLNRQILKGTVARITPRCVEVRFRYRQKNRRLFDDNRRWAIEHDSLDSSCNSMFKSLYAFLDAPRGKREVLLGLAPPGEVSRRAFRETDSPADIVCRAMNARDYFLIVGPPGTGKTSILARRLIEEFHARPDCNIMVLAYTNRAVDELCEAVCAAFGCRADECAAYIRTGSELSCAEPYRHRLLQRISEGAGDRESLRREIERTRIFISTLASICGRKELFGLKHFHVAIIDEASQILEPQIIGLLPLFDRFIMIGDHNQLATIVLQEGRHSAVSEPALAGAGFVDCRDSLFERLLRRCRTQGWHHALAQLTRQGRMHGEIAAFPSAAFYAGKLFPVHAWQSEEWVMRAPSDSFFDRRVAAERTVFFSTENIIRPSSSDKVCETEADLIVALLTSLRRVYEANGRPFDAASTGVIAPYRNQIALIRHKLSAAGLPGWEEIMIDTVERYQGSQRDVILISFCANRPCRMDFLCCPNGDGTVDRKLNVAITRARQQLFLVGNAPVLRASPVYAALLDSYRMRGIYSVVAPDRDCRS